MFWNPKWKSSFLIGIANSMFIPLLKRLFPADEKLVIKMPEGAFYRHDGFKEWYHGVDRFRDQSHIIKALKIETKQSTATVKVIMRWERSDSSAPNPEARQAFYAAQTWTLECGAEAGRLCIIAYGVDYFLEEYLSTK